ncbi:MAG: hypothetical protein EAZ61_09455 [Oscillatoriales cyanobacterium]|nr:MAG: hypothetical protein EAZ61_09455 [Oscillatoriales cyanobacterium]
MQSFWLKRASSQTCLTALRVALIVGSILFVINHGEALITRKMNRTRWISSALTYCVPFIVSLHGQCHAIANRDNT